MEQKRSGFSGKLGFVLAAAGSAVGLGNIWRFPYLTAKYGGGIFLLTYLILVLTFGYALLIAENAIGRMTGKGPIGAFRELCEGKRAFFGCVKYGGWINSIVPMIIIPYYCVIGGWVTKYVFAMVFNPVSKFGKTMMVDVGGRTIPASAAYFQGFIASTWEPVCFLLMFVGCFKFVSTTYGERVFSIRLSVCIIPAHEKYRQDESRPVTDHGVAIYATYRSISAARLSDILPESYLLTEQSPGSSQDPTQNFPSARTLLS